jgi:RNA polymerase primary sigma factor
MTAKSPQYHSQLLADFARQLLFTPKSRRADQITRAEALHDLVEPGQNYPFDFVNYRITGYHSESESIDTTILVGEAILPDLRLIIDELCLSAESMPDDEPMTDLATLATDLNVSTKTIHRWREQGLRWRWFTPEGCKRKVLGFTPSALKHFKKTHPGRLEQAAQRDMMSESDLQNLRENARQIAAASPQMSLNQVASQLAQQTGRALQTIRLQLQKHDEQHPDNVIFPEHHGPLSDRQARQIARLHQRGMSLEQLEQTFGKTASTIRRAMLNARLQVLKRLRIDPVREHASYADPTQIPLLSQWQVRDNDWQTGTTQLPDDLPQLLYLWFARFQLRPEAQSHAFQSYQYLRYTAVQTINELQYNACSATQINTLEKQLKQAGQLRDMLCTSSLPVVMSVARRHMDHVDEQSVYILQDLLILGCQILFHELDQFDPHRKQTFDTFLVWRLQRSFATWLGDLQRAGRAIRRLQPHQVIRRIRTQATHWGIRLPDMPAELGMD